MNANADLVRAAREAIAQLSAKEERRHALPHWLARYDGACAVSQRTAPTPQAEARRRAAEERAGRFERELQRLLGFDPNEEEPRHARARAG